MGACARVAGAIATRRTWGGEAASGERRSARGIHAVVVAGGDQSLRARRGASGGRRRSRRGARRRGGGGAGAVGCVFGGITGCERGEGGSGGWGDGGRRTYDDRSAPQAAGEVGRAGDDQRVARRDRVDAEIGAKHRLFGAEGQERHAFARRGVARAGAAKEEHLVADDEVSALKSDYGTWRGIRELTSYNTLPLNRARAPRGRPRPRVTPPRADVVREELIAAALVWREARRVRGPRRARRRERRRVLRSLQDSGADESLVGGETLGEPLATSPVASPSRKNIGGWLRSRLGGDVGGGDVGATGTAGVRFDAPHARVHRRDARPPGRRPAGG